MRLLPALVCSLALLPAASDVAWGQVRPDDEAGPAIEALQRSQQRAATLAARADGLREQVRQAAAQQEAATGALRMQRASLEAMLEALDVEVEAAQQAQAARAAAPAGPREDPHAWLLTQTLDQARTWVRGSLAWRRAERLERLDALHTLHASGELDALAALGRLWVFLEDEHRMSAAWQLDRQAVDLEGETVLADVLRLGMALLVVRTTDRRTAVLLPGDTRARGLTRPADQQAVLALFDQLLGSATADIRLPAAWLLPPEAP
jgi:hypothetical protein